MGLFGSKKHSIGATIAELRKEKGWTQIELAEKLQVSDKAVSKWEKDSGAPSVEFFPVLAELFGVSIDYIMTGKKPEPEIITISKAELCAKNDDVKLLDGINSQFKDEKGKTIIDYILQYKSYKVFVGFCEQNKQNIARFQILDAITFAILTNRLDLLRGVRFALSSGAYWTFDNERELLGLLPEAIKNKYDYNIKATCILTDEFFEMLVCSEQIKQETMDIILGYQNGRNCVWYHVFPYLIHQSYLHNKTEFLNKLLVLAVTNNEYAYNNIKFDSGNYVPNFFFMGNRYNKSGHGLVRILEETIKLSLEKGDFDNFEKFNSINTAIIKYYDFKPYIASDYEIKMAKLKADKTISKEELTIQSTIHDGIVNIDELLATKNLSIIKKVLTEYPIHPIEIPYKWFKEKNWRKLFEYAVDNNLNQIADYVIDLKIKDLEIQLVNLFYHNSGYDGQPYINGRKFELRNAHLNKNDFDIEKINEYILAYKQQIIADATYELDKEKTIADLTKEYFEAELAKGNAEMVIVKLCVRLEAVLRGTYHYEGDFSEMLTNYCNYKCQDEVAAQYLQKLRKCRNSIVHSEKTQETLSIDEIKYCIVYICKMN